MVLGVELEYSRSLDLLDKISSIICSLYCIVVFIVTLRLFFVAKLIGLSQPKLVNVYIKKIAVLAIIVLISYIVTCITVFMNHWNLYPSATTCKSQMVIEGFIYTTSKFLLYIFLTYRVDIAFDNSTLRYPKARLHFLRILCVILLSIIWVLIYIFVDGKPIKQQHVVLGLTFCQSEIPLYVLGVGLVVDVFLASMCLTLFGRKIWQVCYT